MFFDSCCEYYEGVGRYAGVGSIMRGLVGMLGLGGEFIVQMQVDSTTTCRALGIQNMTKERYI